MLPLYRVNPKNHNPRHFRYIVRGRGLTVDPRRIFNDVAAIASQVNVSASLIEQDYVHTFADYNHGLILQVPPENFLGTSPFDMGNGQTRNSSDVLGNFGLDTPNSLMKKTQALMRAIRSSDRALGHP